MFDIGFSEMVLIGLIALIVLGPKRLPEVARSAGQWIGKLRRFVENVKRDIDAEIKDEDLAAFKQMHAELNETRNLLQKSATDTFKSFSTLNDVAETGSEPITAVETPNPALPTPPPALAPKPGAKKLSKSPGKASPKTVSKKTIRKKATIKKAIAKANRTPHAGVKKT